LKIAGILTIDVMDIMGQALGTVTDKVFSPGKHVVNTMSPIFLMGITSMNSNQATLMLQGSLR
jgi:hypothetical protein